MQFLFYLAPGDSHILLALGLSRVNISVWDWQNKVLIIYKPLVI